MSARNNDSRKTMLVITLLVAAAMPFVLHAHPPVNQVLTPSAKYSDPAWAQKAQKYNSNLARLYSSHLQKYKPDQIHFLTVNESAVGGIGFWGNPANFGEPSRYLCIFARVRCPEPCTGRAFPNTQTGRIMTVMDAFGKFTISQMANELKGMPDQNIKGAAMIFIYDRKSVDDPTFEQNAEAFALFMPRDAVMKFAELRMTIQSLFSQSQMLPIFAGGEQIKNMRQFIIQP